jgi:hypothetical protein
LCIFAIFIKKRSKDAAHLLMGRSRKDPHSPHRRNFCRSGRGDQIVSDNSKCVRTSEGDRGVNFQFPQWGWYGCFLEWPNLTYIIKHIVSFNKSVKNSQDTQQLLMSHYICNWVNDVTWLQTKWNISRTKHGNKNLQNN